MSLQLPSGRVAARDLELGTRLCSVSLAWEAGDCVVVTGPNGSGKSSLLRALLGLLEPDRGEVLLDGVPLAQLSRRQVAKKLAWLPQHAHLAEPRLAEELVASARFHFDEPWSVALVEARRALERLQAAHLSGRRTDRMSGGELQRVLLAGLWAQGAPLLLVDEPANHLDPLQQIAVYRKLGELWREGRGLLVVTHELGLARFLGDAAGIRVLGLDRGRIAVDERLDSPQLATELTKLAGVPYRSGARPGALTIDWENVE